MFTVSFCLIVAKKPCKWCWLNFHVRRPICTGHNMPMQHLLLSLVNDDNKYILCIITIVPFHNDFPLAVSNLNNVNQLMHYNNQLPLVKQCFYKHCCNTKHGGIIANVNLRNLVGGGGGGLLICPIPQWGVCRAWIKRSCHNFPLVRDKPLGAPAYVRLVFWRLFLDPKAP